MGNGNSTRGTNVLGSLLMGVGMAIGATRMLTDVFAELSGLNELAPEPQGPQGRLCGDGSDPKCKVYKVHKIEDRVGHIAHLVRRYSENPEFVLKARQIVSQKKANGQWAIAERDYQGEIKAIWTFTKSNMRYVRDHASKDTYYNPVANLKSGGGDCDDFVIVTGSLLRAIGYQVGAKVYRTRKAADWNHIALVVNPNPKTQLTKYDAGKWLTIDASVSQVPYKGKLVKAFPGWDAEKDTAMIAASRVFII